MNSKMTALVAILAVGVLAAAGLGYAWSAQYISDENELNGQFVLISDLTDGSDKDVMAEFNTKNDRSTNTYGVVTTSTDAAIVFHLEGEATNLIAGNTYTLSLASGSEIILSDGSKLTYNGTTWAWTISSTEAKKITAWTTLPTITVSTNTYTPTGTAGDIVETTNVDITLTIAQIQESDGMISTGAESFTPGSAYFDSVNLKFTITKVVPTP